MRRIDLKGKWTLSQIGKKDKFAAQVPGDTHSALLEAGKIPDPYDKFNELDLQWIGREDWSYSRSFELKDEFLRAQSIFLNCDSLDTIAELFINGKLAGKSDNMFARLRLDVASFLKKGRNEIEIILKSAENEAVKRAKKLPYPVPHGINIVQSPNRNLVRKVQCHSGWDWGPCLMVSGIYGEIYLEAVETGRIDHVYTTQKHSKGHCEVEIFCEINSPNGGETDFEVSIGDLSSKKTCKLVPGFNLLSSKLSIKNPSLWWPNGYGEQALHDFTVKACGGMVKKKLGLRSLELINKEDAKGLSMFFRVNGVDVFCKGADWIPCDALPQRQTKEAIDDLLTSAAKVGMNMLRVWGGGQYESDDFYSLCDQKGLLIWQDFMFSCSLYPASKEFLASVKLEAEHQVKRLRDFACIALWCGDNENVGAMTWFEESRKNRDRYLVDYDRLNEGVLGKAIDEFDPTRKFWPSSPCGGRGDYSDCWHNDTRGDMHYWDVWHGGKPFEEFYKIKPRFCSEFGYQSFPSIDTIRTYAEEHELNVTNPVMEHHQRNGGGNSKIIEMMSRYFRMPEGFENFVYLSQVQQALAIKTASEHWRRLRPHCMGVIYWQLNDNWPVCSWASLEYQGKWKLLHYMAARFFAQVMLTGIKSNDGGFEVWAVNDHLRDLDASLIISFVDLNGKVLKRETLKAKLKKAGAQMLKEFKPQSIPFKASEGFVRIELESDGGSASNEVFLAPWKAMSLPETDVKLSVGAGNGGSFNVEVSVTKPALFLSLNVNGVAGEFDDNCVTLLPGKAKRFVFTPKSKISLSEFKEKLSFRHLRMSYK
ncbi:MAG: hypothetical protein A2X49_07910 [Lentisphaerae bacterium GWF2_52_8]|nr:MAG: hypothetical protein A2X49_07910 [Lentisphaerae bacterium GWF2_52_8]